MSLQRAKTLLSDPLNKNDFYSKQILNTINHLKKNYLSIDNIIKFKNKKDYFLSDSIKKEDTIFIMIDTETTGLQTDNKLDSYIDSEKNKHEFISYRNQISEIGGVTYNWNFEFERLDEELFFHGKVNDENLNEHNSIYKIEQSLISKFNLFYLDNKDNISNAFKLAQEKSGKFNPDYNVFKNNFPSIFDYMNEYDRHSIIKHIFKYNLLLAIRQMNHSDKQKYRYLYDLDKTYNVKKFGSELEIIESFYSFIENKKNQYSTVIIGAHNLPYDEGMLKGAIVSAIDYYTYIEEDSSLVEHYQNLLKRHFNIFNNTINTIDIFRDILNNKKYGNRLLNLYISKPKIKKIKTIRHLVKSLQRKKYSSGSFSVSLGNLAPISLNRDFHTTINDINVTIETLKLYFCIPLILDYNNQLKLESEHKNILEEIL
jgi:hypothetical protein